MPIGQYGPPTDFFPVAPWNLTQDVAACVQTYGISPRPDWIRTAFGGKSMQVCVSLGSFIGGRCLLPSPMHRCALTRHASRAARSAAGTTAWPHKMMCFQTGG